MFHTTKKGLLKRYENWQGSKKWRYLADIKEFSKYVSKGAAVLDHGCFDGRASHLLASRGYKVTGYDFNPLAIKAALKNYGKEGIKFQKKDLTRLPKTPQFDAIFSRNVLTDFEAANRPGEADKFEAGLRNLYKVIKSGGMIFATAYTEIAKFGWKDKPKSYSPNQIRKRFGKYFEFVDYRIESEGKGKNYTERVVLVGRKR